MIKIIKTLIISIVLISSALAKNIMCPKSITCDYEAGVCLDESGNHLEKMWYIWSSKKIENEVRLLLNNINIQTGIMPSFSNIKPYHLLQCSYGNDDGLIGLSRDVRRVKGNGVTRSGFGNSWPSCTSPSPITNPELCYGEI